MAEQHISETSQRQGGKSTRTLFSLLLNDGWNGAMLPATAAARVVIE